VGHWKPGHSGNASEPQVVIIYLSIINQVTGLSKTNINNASKRLVEKDQTTEVC
jgi:hypothetical protein